MLDLHNHDRTLFYLALTQPLQDAFLFGTVSMAGKTGSGSVVHLFTVWPKVVLSELCAWLCALVS